jgi:hypothetical protein
MRKVFVCIMALALSLLSSGVTLPQSLQITENLRHETVALGTGL